MRKRLGRWLLTLLHRKRPILVVPQRPYFSEYHSPEHRRRLTNL